MEWIYVDSGQEADVYKAQTNTLETLAGTLRLKDPLVVARRVNKNKPIRHYEGHDLFFKNLSMKILDDYFLKRGSYSHEHIPRPLGSFNNETAGYYYEFMEGEERFPWKITDEDNRPVSVQMQEWNIFSCLFGTFGFNVDRDVADTNDGRVGKNIIISDWDVNEVYETRKLSADWKRIDFGSFSCPIRHDKFEDEMKQKEKEMRELIGTGYDLALSSARYHAFNGLVDTPLVFQRLLRKYFESFE